MRHAFDAALEKFERALDEFERNEDEAPPPRLLPHLTGALPDASAAVGGCHSLWEHAASWTPEADPPPPRPAPPPPPRPSARAEDIAAELRLHALGTPAEVARARRRFMWENHPDRRGDLDRDLAHRRVATANMLLDRAFAAARRRVRQL